LWAGGRSLLVLLPSERAAMLAALEAARVPLKPLKINPGKTQPVGPALQALLSKSAELKVRRRAPVPSLDALPFTLHCA
jgi:ATP-dependent RNA helicase DDX10/DBP4